jgi:glycerol-3-phosphate dehydrogenase (NAD(P)+)
METIKIKKDIAVLGAGSWGTALAIHLANNRQSVRLWGRNREKLAHLQKECCNSQYLPAVSFPPALAIETDISKALQGINDILIAVPSHAFRETLLLIKPYLTSQSRLLWATKGLDPKSHTLLHEVVEEVIGKIPMAVLSGPNFAKEVAKGLPTAVTIATTSAEFAEDLTKRFHCKTFRVYTTADIIGVEIGGAMKNVLAIAVGIIDGLGFGANARSALITRGLAEMVRLGTALDGKPETFMGLAGLGDLILTCTDNQSRNRRLGLALGENKSRQAAEQEIGQVVEGIRTAEQIYYVTQKVCVETPICEQVYRVLYENLPPQKAVDNLLSREPKKENC